MLCHGRRERLKERWAGRTAGKLAFPALVALRLGATARSRVAAGDERSELALDGAKAARHSRVCDSRPDGVEVVASRFS
jgi:hypothetical protein